MEVRSKVVSVSKKGMYLRNVCYINSGEPAYLWDMESKWEREVKNYFQISTGWMAISFPETRKEEC